MLQQNSIIKADIIYKFLLVINVSHGLTYLELTVDVIVFIIADNSIQYGEVVRPDMFDITAVF